LEFIYLESSPLQQNIAKIDSAQDHTSPNKLRPINLWSIFQSCLPTEPRDAKDLPITLIPSLKYDPLP